VTPAERLLQELGVTEPNEIDLEASHHRGRALVCRVDDYQPRDTLSPERVADAYAAGLFMPRYLFDPAMQQHPKLTLKAVTALSDQFDTSFTATAIRVVEGSYYASRQETGRRQSAQDRRRCMVRSTKC